MPDTDDFPAETVAGMRTAPDAGAKDVMPAEMSSGLPTADRICSPPGPRWKFKLMAGFHRVRP